MIYLDYSANTPADPQVLDRFCSVERRCIGNANSHHQAGTAARAEIDAATLKIAALLGVQPAEIIYTSGASESNNFALKGLARLSRHAGRHIISTPLEHSSVSGTLTALQEQGYEIDLLDIRRDGTVDLDHLKEKVEAGCEFLTTQMFFDNNILYNFMYKALKRGIDVPVVAGIMPVTNASQIKRIVSLSGNMVPPRFLAIVDRFKDDPKAMRQAGIAYATEQIIDLIANGVNHVHIYTMNKPDIAAAIFENLSDIYVRE